MRLCSCWLVIHSSAGPCPYTTGIFKQTSWSICRILKANMPCKGQVTYKQQSLRGAVPLSAVHALADPVNCLNACVWQVHLLAIRYVDTSQHMARLVSQCALCLKLQQKLCCSASQMQAVAHDSSHQALWEAATGGRMTLPICRCVEASESIQACATMHSNLHSSCRPKIEKVYIDHAGSCKVLWVRLSNC